jgi:2-hydroxy-3-oxopropionate reductase
LDCDALKRLQQLRPQEVTMPEPKLTIAFIGLGIMGKPMARHLLAAGHALVVCDVNPAPVAELAALGASVARSPREACARSDAAITMLPDSADVEAVALGADGVLAGLKPGAIYADMSTISPITWRLVAAEATARGIRPLDAPVSGGQVGAEQAALTIMVGGDAATFAEFLPVFQLMGKRITRVGDAGAGQVVKACNQIVVATTIEGVSEALVLGSKAGVDPAVIREVLLGGFAQSRILELHGQRMLDRNFAPGFKIKLHRKDLGIALAAGKEYGVPLPVTAQVNEMLGALIVAGRGEDDHSAIATLLEGLAGKPIK